MTDTSVPRPIQSDAIPPSRERPTDPLDAQRASQVPAPATRNPLRRTRASAVWIGVIVFAALLVLLLIFILQNTQPVQISYFTLTGSVSLAVAMLLAAVAGVLLTAIAGSLRIWQLRRRVPRSARH